MPKHRVAEPSPCLLGLREILDFNNPEVVFFLVQMDLLS